jgi:hypothetical protein
VLPLQCGRQGRCGKGLGQAVIDGSKQGGQEGECYLPKITLTSIIEHPKLCQWECPMHFITVKVKSRYFFIDKIKCVKKIDSSSLIKLIVSTKVILDLGKVSDLSQILNIKFPSFDVLWRKEVKEVH